MRTFLIVWLGQVVSVLGSQMTGFALGIYVFQQTGSVTRFSFIILAANLPGIVVGPFAGSLVDRLPRRLVMIGADTLAGLATLVAALLFFSGSLTIGAIYAIAVLGSLANTFQEPAYTASVPLLVPKEHLGRANGLIQLGPAIGLLGAPVAAGFLIVAAGLGTILVIDVVTFLVALGTLIAVRIPDPEPSDEEVRPSLWADVKEGFFFLWRRTGLFLIMMSALILNFLFGFFNVLIIPLFLTFTTAEAAGIVFTIGGLGMVLGSIVMSAWGGPKRRIRGAVMLMATAGIGFMVMGWRNSVVLVAVGTFGLMSTSALVNGTFQTFWQVKIPLAMQGRVFAMRRMLATLATPAAYLLAGPLADQVFEPAMADGGSLADGWVGSLLGTGPGRGIGLMFVLIGIGAIATVLLMYTHPRVRHVETELPDVVVDDESSSRPADPAVVPDQSGA